MTFWDALSGTPVKSIKAHLADVLCLTTNDSGTKVFSSGVDRKVVQFTLTNLEDPKAWVVSGEKRYHSHDVRAIEWIQERPFECLVTGGMDTLLIMSHPVEEFPYLKQYRLPPFPHQSRVRLAKTARLLMCQFDTEIKVWKMGQGNFVVM